MASCFEAEALTNLNIVIDNIKKMIEEGREEADPWPTKLVRQRVSFEGLRDIKQVMPLNEAQRAIFRQIKEVRNNFAHQGHKISSPELDGDDALPILLQCLAILT